MSNCSASLFANIPSLFVYSKITDEIRLKYNRIDQDVGFGFHQGFLSMSCSMLCHRDEFSRWCYLFTNINWNLCFLLLFSISCPTDSPSIRVWLSPGAGKRKAGQKTSIMNKCQKPSRTMFFNCSRWFHRLFPPLCEFRRTLSNNNFHTFCSEFEFNFWFLSLICTSKFPLILPQLVSVSTTFKLELKALNY